MKIVLIMIHNTQNTSRVDDTIFETLQLNKQHQL